ncbi:hypothetical protein JK628_21850 [Shewanella sp. KX20019]|uniref:hypothetical protein n=1 Tax=Shewanella sp. KX20019 TaxID=2803864 RepID=UPI001925D07C|nr:hypothetical protein [Shewanella sp. KX20019]QQX80091.1 hypothetical protein JK628_21850 [Shewanella sp. KX20019]
MKGLLKKTATFRATVILAVVTAAVGTISLTSQSSDLASSACVCDTATSSYNPGLPASHPNNRCASQSDDLSWKSWLSGKSQNNQLHFIDLLELLHGHQSAPMSNGSPMKGE